MDTSQKIFDQEFWSKNCAVLGHTDTCTCRANVSQEEVLLNPMTGKPVQFVDAKHKVPHDERYSRLAEKFIAARKPEEKTERNRARNRRRRKR